MTILVCLDETSASPRVLRHAVAFSKASAHNLHLIRVLDPRADITAAADEADEVIASVSASWEEDLFDQMRKAGGSGHVSVPVLASRQSVSQAIVETANKVSARAIVMGSHGAGLIRRTVLGSVAMGVVSTAECPVLVVGPRAAETPAESEHYTLLITDEGNQASRAAVDALQPLLRTGDLWATVLHLYEPRLGDDGEHVEMERAMEALETERDAFPHPERVTCLVRKLPDFERTDAAILRIAQESGAQAVALATRGYSTRQHIVAGSVAVGVLKHAELPVMLVRRP